MDNKTNWFDDGFVHSDLNICICSIFGGTVYVKNYGWHVVLLFQTKAVDEIYSMLAVKSQNILFVKLPELLLE